MGKVSGLSLNVRLRIEREGDEELSMYVDTGLQEAVQCMMLALPAAAKPSEKFTKLVHASYEWRAHVCVCVCHAQVGNKLAFTLGSARGR